MLTQEQSEFRQTGIGGDAYAIEIAPSQVAPGSLVWEITDAKGNPLCGGASTRKREDLERDLKRYVTRIGGSCCVEGFNNCRRQWRDPFEKQEAAC